MWSRDEETAASNIYQLRMSVPDLCRCPITRCIMRDPVLLVESGHTFDRHSIETWLQDQATCPISRTKLVTKSLVTNWMARMCIAHFANSKPAPKKRRPIVRGQESFTGTSACIHLDGPLLCATTDITKGRVSRLDLNVYLENNDGRVRPRTDCRTKGRFFDTCKFVRVVRRGQHTYLTGMAQRLLGDWVCWDLCLDGCVRNVNGRLEWMR